MTHKQVDALSTLREHALDEARKRDTHHFAMELMKQAERETGKTSYERYLAVKVRQCIPVNPTI